MANEQGVSSKASRADVDAHLARQLEAARRPDRGGFDGRHPDRRAGMIRQSQADASGGVRRYDGRDAIRRLHAELECAGWLPPAIAELDPDYLAGGFEGDYPGA